MKRVLDIARGVEYGNEGKKRWTKIGALFIHEEGGMSIRFDVPAPHDVWLNVFDRDEKKQEEPEVTTQVEEDEDVPF